MSERESGLPKEAQEFTASAEVETPKPAIKKKSESKPKAENDMPYGRYTYPGWESDWQAVKMGLLGEYEMDGKQNSQ